MKCMGYETSQLNDKNHQDDKKFGSTINKKGLTAEEVANLLGTGSINGKGGSDKGFDEFNKAKIGGTYPKFLTLAYGNGTKNSSKPADYPLLSLYLLATAYFRKTQKDAHNARQKRQRESNALFYSPDDIKGRQPLTIRGCRTIRGDIRENDDGSHFFGIHE